jgi:hypothetical protein
MRGFLAIKRILRLIMSDFILHRHNMLKTFPKIHLILVLQIYFRYPKIFLIQNKLSNSPNPPIRYREILIQDLIKR